MLHVYFFSEKEVIFHIYIHKTEKVFLKRKSILQNIIFKQKFLNVSFIIFYNRLLEAFREETI